MKNSRILILLIVSVVAVNYTEGGILNPQKLENDEAPITILRTYMTMRVIGNGSGTICVSCYSGSNASNNRQGCSSRPTDVRVLSWNFNAGASTKFWCSATWGTKIISKFPVFGDGVPKKSSDWRVDSSGKLRTHEDGKTRNDYRGWWSS